MSPRASQRGRGAGRGRTATPSHSLSRSWLIWVVIGAVVVAGIAAIAISAGGGDEASGAEIADEVTVEGSDLPPLPDSGDDPAVGEPAPGLEGTSPTGRPESYEPGGGEPSVVVILAHWCPHCQAEVPRIVALADAGGTDGVSVYGITTGTNSSQDNYPPSEWLGREDWPFPVIADTENQDGARAYGLVSYPFFVFVDGAGNVAGRLTGEVSEDELAILFDELRNGDQLSIPSAGGSSPAD
ncbi:MAG: TlpA family protein disulfide reductase [Acidimicrobiia bacterium]